MILYLVYGLLNVNEKKTFKKMIKTRLGFDKKKYLWEKDQS